MLLTTWLPFFISPKPPDTLTTITLINESPSSHDSVHSGEFGSHLGLYFKTEAAVCPDLPSDLHSQ